MVVLECKEMTFREDVMLEAEEGKVSIDMWQPVTRIPDLDQKYKLSWECQDRLQVGMLLEEFRDILLQYCSRQLSHEKDILNAFTGVLKTFSPTLGECRFGMPLRFLSLMLLWKSEGRLRTTKRAGLDIPSWSWAAWRGNEVSLDSRGGFLRNASSPVLFFFELSTGDESIAIPSSDLISDPTSLAHLDDKIKTHCTTITPPCLEDFPNFKPTSSFCNYLLFGTSMALFRIDRRPDSTEDGNASRGTYNCHVHEDSERIVGTITLSHEWRKSQPDWIEFIALAVSYGHLLHLMAVEWVDGVAQRVEVLNQPVDQKVWFDANPQRKLILLG